MLRFLAAAGAEEMCMPPNLLVLLRDHNLEFGQQVSIPTLLKVVAATAASHPTTKWHEQCLLLCRCELVPQCMHCLATASVHALCRNQFAIRTLWQWDD
jgi:hypothetical protein